jgi:hypothetical protein
MRTDFHAALTVSLRIPGILPHVGLRRKPNRARWATLSRFKQRWRLVPALVYVKISMNLRCTLGRAREILAMLQHRLLLAERTCLRSVALQARRQLIINHGPSGSMNRSLPLS